MKRFLQCVAFLLFAGNAFAANIAGMEMSYKYLGAGNYKISVVVYRDCNGIQVSTSPLNVRYATGNFSFTPTLESSEDITPVNAACATSKCAGGKFPYGIERLTYSGIVNLGSYSACEFVISWEQCCWSGAVNTGAAGENMYVDLLINRCYDSTNSSPVFANKPLVLVAASQIQNHSVRVVDTIDGFDSVSYEMSTPLRAYKDTIRYGSSFGAYQPLTYLGHPKTNLPAPSGFHLDQRGNMQFQATKVGQVTIFVVKVKEWKKVNDTMRLVSMMHRDMQVLVMSDQVNTQPQIKTFGEMGACVGNTQDIEIPIRDKDTADKLSFQIVSDYPGLSYKIVSSPNTNDSTKVVFTFNPTAQEVRDKPYFINLTVNDSNCKGTIYGESSYTYDLIISPAIDQNKPAFIIAEKNCSGFDFMGIDTFQAGYGKWIWKEGADIIGSAQQFNYQFQKKGPKVIDLYAYKGACYVKSSINLQVDSVYKLQSSITASHVAACRNTPITINTTISGGTSPYTYDWGRPNLNAYQINIAHDTNTYGVIITDSNKCIANETVTVALYENPEVDAGTDKFKCTNDPNGITLTANAPMFWTLNFDWLGIAKTSTVNVNPSVGANLYIVEVTDAKGCTARDSITVTGYELVISAGSDTSFCKPVSNLQLTATSNVDPAYLDFEWKNTGNGQTITVNTAQTKTITLQVKDSLNCMVTDNITIFVHTPPQLLLVPGTSVCQNSSVTLDAQGNGSSPFIYEWIFEGNTYTTKRVVVNATQTGNSIAELTIKDVNGCTASGNATYTVKALPVVTFTPPDHICNSSSVPLLLSNHVQPSGGAWYENGNNIGTSMDPSQSDSGKRRIVYTYLDPVSACNNSDTAEIYVVQRSEIDFTASVTTGLAPLAVDFTSAITSYTPVQTYLWEFGDPANSTSSLVNPSFTYTTSGVYDVQLTLGSLGYCPDEVFVRQAYITVNQSGGVRELSEEAVQVFPLPSTGLVFVRASDQYTITKLRWFDMNGKLVGEMESKGKDASLEIETPGVYVLQLFSGNQLLGHRKMVIQK